MISTALPRSGYAGAWTPLRAIVTGGLLAGAFDMSYALAYFAGVRGAPPIKIPQSIAAGLLGKAAFDGGAATAALGVALHWFNALVMAAIFVLIARRALPALIANPIPSGLAYGAACYFVMNYIVLPLDAMHTQPHYVALTWWSGLLVHMFGVGLSISLSAARTAPLR